MGSTGDLGEACLMGEAPEGRGGIQRDEPWTSLGGFLHWNRREAGEAGYRARDSSGLVADL